MHDTAGQRYQANWIEVDPTPSQLRTADRRLPDEVEPFLALPDDLPQVIADTAAQVAGSAATPYDAAVAIQAFLRSPDFEYSTEAPVEEGYDGGGFDVIAQFLETRAGYCVHFASTMAVLARESGIPARIAVGYTQGSPSQERVGGVQRIEVDSHDLHAWPELYFEGVGWVPFEPTPGRGIVPDYSRPGAGQGAGEPVPQSGTAAPSASGRAEVDPGGGLGGAGGGLDLGRQLVAARRRDRAARRRGAARAGRAAGGPACESFPPHHARRTAGGCRVGRVHRDAHATSGSTWASSTRHARWRRGSPTARHSRDADAARRPDRAA